MLVALFLDSEIDVFAGLRYLCHQLWCACYVLSAGGLTAIFVFYSQKNIWLNFVFVAQNHSSISAGAESWRGSDTKYGVVLR